MRAHGPWSAAFPRPRDEAGSVGTAVPFLASAFAKPTAQRDYESNGLWTLARDPEILANSVQA